MICAAFSQLFTIQSVHKIIKWTLSYNHSDFKRKWMFFYFKVLFQNISKNPAFLSWTPKIEWNFKYFSIFFNWQILEQIILSNMFRFPSLKKIIIIKNKLIKVDRHQRQINWGWRPLKFKSSQHLGQKSLLRSLISW